MPFFVVEGAQIPRVEDRDAKKEAKRDELIRCMMQGIARDPDAV